MCGNDGMMSNFVSKLFFFFLETQRYKLRLFIDESISFGTIGAHGKGITELKNISVKHAISQIGFKKERKKRKAPDFPNLVKLSKLIFLSFACQLNDIDLIMGSLETALGSIGGFCAGTTYIVEHQTLAGLGERFN